MNIALVQLTSTEAVDQNLRTSARLANDAVSQGARWLLYPENAPFLGADRARHEVAEDLQGRMVSAYRQLATKHGVWVTLGGFPEAVDGQPDKTYNTQVLIAPSGELAAVYRKIHLFDARVDKHTAYRESDHVVPGCEPVIAEVTIDDESVMVGLTTCYDLRFPELYRSLRCAGAEIFTVPSAFTLQTGRDHWHPLLQARAIENQAYVLAPDQLGHHGGSRWSYGHSVVYDPWGQQVATAGDRESYVATQLDLEYLRDIRERMPVHEHRKLD